MSPEQLRSAADVDARADIWATGVVLYELLTGRRPFQGDGLAELVTAILHLPPTPLTLAGSNVPAGLDHVISRCPGDGPEPRDSPPSRSSPRSSVRSRQTPPMRESITS